MAGDNADSHTLLSNILAFYLAQVARLINRSEQRYGTALSASGFAKLPPRLLKALNELISNWEL